MVVGAATVRLHIEAARSLKDKRSVVRSLLERLRGRFNVAAAEVDSQDRLQEAVIGLAVVGSDGGAVRRYLGDILDYVETHAAGALVCDTEVEVR
ncbi:MAG: DUF503 domain-containing protein [Clostridia bacterium]|nr:DUF503 domain-containing protein [Clostridia bacterium]